MIQFAIVGLGPWGLSVLERTVSYVRRTGVATRVHVVEPGAPGGGTYRDTRSDYLILNNACGLLSLYAAPDPDQDPPYAVGLYQWAVREGYRWVGHECRRDPGGRPITPDDYLPRRLMGEYLRWFYSALVASAPSCMEIVWHATRAVDIEPLGSGRERVHLEAGEPITVDHVVITSGHTENQLPNPGERRGLQAPYPAERFAEEVPAGSTIGIAGMGLVAYDLVAAMTIGRGGSFEEIGGRQRYRRSGNEVSIHLFSRTGLPYAAKSAASIDPGNQYPLIVCTPEWFRSLRGPDQNQKVDFRAQVVPGLYEEMRCRYHLHAATLHGGDRERAGVASLMRSAHAAGDLGRELRTLERRYGRFDPSDRFLPQSRASYASSGAYQARVYDLLQEDLDQSLQEGGSPVKAAYEMTRVLRDQLRSVIEFGRLTADSYVDFQTHVHSNINSLEAGPPALRSAQLMALLDEGVVRTPTGPSPSLEETPDGGVVVGSTRLDEPFRETVSSVVRGYLDMPRLVDSASPMLRKLVDRGRLTELHYDWRPVGSVGLSETFHPYDRAGSEQGSLSLLGVLTEGVRYFTHYLPSPNTRLRAVLDAQACVEGILA
jgi:FAD-NAD(P)-binding